MNMRIFSKVTSAMALLLISSSVMAGWGANFLVGGTGGYGWRNGNVDIEDFAYRNNPPRTLVDISSKTQKLSDHGFLGGVFGGLQIHCNRFLLGLEVGADWDHVDSVRPFSFQAGNTAATALTYHGSMQYKRGTVLGMSLRAGYKLYPWFMPYIRLGAETSRDKLIYSSQTVTIPATVLSLQGEDSRRVWRFLGGIGVETPLFWMLTGRIEYNYSSEGRSVGTSALSVDAPIQLASPFQQHFLDTRQDQHTAKVSVVLNLPNFM